MARKRWWKKFLEAKSEKKFLKTSVGIFLLGCFLGELAPDPTDAIHFYLQQHVFNNPDFSKTTLTLLQVYDWYFLSASYFLLLLILAYILHIKKVDIVKKITIIGGILGIGAVIGLLFQFFIKI
ncbi:MAG: hypothetical protein NTU63_03420 [Candidatus Pacearchaeota archaeon]|nr:hypothetical protein [Candidatus Pacearchaeota archaeon]